MLPLSQSVSGRVEERVAAAVKDHTPHTEGGNGNDMRAGYYSLSPAAFLNDTLSKGNAVSLCSIVHRQGD